MDFYSIYVDNYRYDSELKRLLIAGRDPDELFDLKNISQKTFKTKTSVKITLFAYIFLDQNRNQGEKHRYVELLLNFGADPNFVPICEDNKYYNPKNGRLYHQYGRTALENIADSSMGNNYWEVKSTELLIKFGANLGLVPTFLDSCITTEFNKRNSEKNLQMVEMLIKYNPICNKKNDNWFKYEWKVSDHLSYITKKLQAQSYKPNGRKGGIPNFPIFQILANLYIDYCHQYKPIDQKEAARKRRDITLIEARKYVNNLKPEPKPEHKPIIVKPVKDPVVVSSTHKPAKISIESLEIKESEKIIKNKNKAAAFLLLAIHNLQYLTDSTDIIPDDLKKFLTNFTSQLVVKGGQNMTSEEIASLEIPDGMEELLNYSEKLTAIWED